MSSGRGDVNGGECNDWLRLALVENREVVGGQAANWLAIFIEDRHIELDDVDACTKCRRLLIYRRRCLRQPDNSDDDGQRSEAEHAYTTPAFFIAAIVVSSASFAPSSGDMSCGTRPSGSGLMPPS